MKSVLRKIGFSTVALVLLALLAPLSVIAAAPPVCPAVATPAATISPYSLVGGRITVEAFCEDFTSAANGKVTRSVMISPGQYFDVVLCSNPSTGFQWSVPALVADTSIVSQGGHSFLSPATNLVGAAGKEVWTFYTLKQGQTTLYFEYSQPQVGGVKAQRTFTLTVIVSPATVPASVSAYNLVGGRITMEASCNDFDSAPNGLIVRELIVSPGQYFDVVLCSNPSTGFQWSANADIDDPTVVSQGGHSFLPPAGSMPGAAGKEIWTFNALKTGEAFISLEYSQPWQGGVKAVWVFNLIVVVRTGVTPSPTVTPATTVCPTAAATPATATPAATICPLVPAATPTPTPTPTPTLCP